jgi:hypothetical protein
LVSVKSAGNHSFDAINIEFRDIVNQFILSGALHAVSKLPTLAHPPINSPKHPEQLEQDAIPGPLLSLLP